MTDATTWKPTWAVSPGEVLAEALEERGMTQAELGRRMARPLKTISEIATGKAAITPETAIQLERALGISATTWLSLESRYRAAQARERDLAELESHVTWLKQFPIKELLKRKIVARSSTGAERASQLLSFFGVSSPVGWDQHWGQLVASYRMSERRPVSLHAVALWLREAEREAEEAELPDYRATQLRALVPKLRPLSREPVIGGAIDAARRLLNAAGVGLLLIEGVQGAPASGAVHWVRGNPWIVLTLRYRTDDQLWFSLFHEIGHLLEGGRRPEVVEEIGDEEPSRPDEQTANEFARESLLPQDELNRWLAEDVIDRASVTRFAASQGVSPGIVVGRLQRDRRLKPSELNYLKRHFETPRRR
jgi:addiction module HigA family antidote